MTSISGAAFNGPVKITGLPVTVPADFIGLQAYKYPGTSPAPSFPYGTASMHDWDVWGVSPVFWNMVEQSAGVYTWTKVDQWLAGQTGKNILWKNLFCPDFYSVNTGVQAQSWPAYTGIGGPLTAGGLTAFGNYITALINHCIAAGKPIKYLQPWQEPNFPSSVGVGYWWGNDSQLVDMAYTAYTAAKAADPTITVLSPSLHYDQFSTYFVNTAGTANPTKHGYDCCDEWATDRFNSGAPAFGKGVASYTGGLYGSSIDLPTCINAVVAATTAHVKPICISSFGLDYVGTGANTASNFAQAQSPQWRKEWLGRALLYMAVRGITRVELYSYDMYARLGQWFLGDFINDIDGVIAAVNEFVANVVGKTITTCVYYHGGPITATFSDTTTYTI